MNQQRAAKKLLLTFGFSSCVSLSLFAARVVSTGSHRYSFLVWNLFLAWLPLIFVIILSRLRLSYGLSWQSFVLGLLWFVFLPNSFYIGSDFVHLLAGARANALYDAALLLSFTVNGLLLGYTSLYIMHRHLLTRASRKRAHTIIGLVLLVCSFGIYLGRFLRWNTWDVVLNPAGLLFDVSDRFISPRSYPQTYTITLTFFVLLAGMYVVVWNLISVIRQVSNHSTPQPRRRGRWMDFKAISDGIDKTQ